VSLGGGLFAGVNRIRSIGKALRPEWKAVFALSVLASFFYVGMEWLFFATKPSFMSGTETFVAVSILLINGLTLSLATLLASLVLWAMGWIPILGSASAWLRLNIARLVPSAVLTVSAILLIDNFSLTVFGFGIRSSEGLVRWFCLGLVPVVFVLVSWQVSKIRYYRVFGWAALFALAGSLPGFAIQASQPTPAGTEDISGEVKSLPNILLLSGDGLDAENLSMYGYERETTPYLKEFSSKTLFCENAYCNGGPSGASLASVLTSKLPTETRLIYPPDILHGEDSYQHLPMILGRLGYRSIQLSMRYYADAFDSNMLESFDVSNSQRRRDSEISSESSLRFGQESAYFQKRLRERVTSRAKHLLGIQRIEDVFKEVTQPNSYYRREVTHINTFFDFIEEDERPFFAMVHLLGTHGAKFSPVMPVFSKGQAQDQYWMRDFYDDAIRNFDRYVEWITSRLREAGRFDNTLLVIYSDHGVSHQTEYRLPLLFRFPGNTRKGRIKPNTQNLDIAPTVLDYLGVPVPSWMSGRSLLSDELDPLEPIIAAKRISESSKNSRGLFSVVVEANKASYFSLGKVRLTICHKTFQIDLQRFLMTVFDVEGHTARCQESQIPSPKGVEELVRKHLLEMGYDVPPGPMVNDVLVNQEKYRMKLR
jgi:arylsulfatase A-like enzyme